MLRHDSGSGSRYAFARRVPGIGTIGKGLVTLSLAVTLAACNMTTLQVGSAIATPTSAPTTVAAAPTATATIAPVPTVAPAASVAPTAIPTQAGAASPAPTRTVGVTPTRPASSPTAAPAASGGVVRDEDLICQAAVPAGFTVDSAGDGFDADDENGFGVLTGTTGDTRSPEDLAQSLFANFTSLLTDVEQGKVTTTADSSRIDFTGALVDNQSDGSVYVKKFGTTVCAVSVLTYEGAQAPHATTMTMLIGTMRENK